MSDDVLIRVENVSKKFCRDLKRSLWYGVKDIASELAGQSKKDHALRKGEFWAVKDVSFELRRGECLGLIGHNGAGKSTLLKMLNGLIKPDKGRITMHGRVGALIELGAGFNPILTGRENLYINGQILGFSKKEIDQKFDAIVDFAEVGEFIDTPIQNYSSGMKVRLGFAIASQMEPDVLLIDEVLAVGDIAFRIKCLNRLSELLSNCAVIFVSHNMQQIARISNAALLMKGGTVAGHSSDIHRIIEKYFELISSEKQMVLGTGQAEIHTFTLNSGNSEKPKFGDEISINISYQIHHGVKGQHILILNFLDVEMKILSALTSEIVENERAWNLRKMVVRFKNIFNTGRITINASIVEIKPDGTRGTFLVNIQAIKVFYTQSNSKANAGTLIRGVWTQVA